MSIMVFDVDPLGGPVRMKVEVGASASTAPQIERCKCINFETDKPVAPKSSGDATYVFKVKPKEPTFYIFPTLITQGDDKTSLLLTVTQGANTKWKKFKTELKQDAFRRGVPSVDLQ